ncbi:MAG: hypothetical protein V1778_00435, partial [bacterium]
MRRRWKFASFLLLCVGLGAAFVWRQHHEHTAPVAATSEVLDSLFRADVRTALTQAVATRAVSLPQAAILPHHLTARSLIVSLVQTLRDATPATIVIIGPDHQNAGSSSTTTTTSDWASHGV